MKLAQFVATPETRSALQAVRRIAAAVRAGQSPRDALPLFLHGPPGVGKSHLAAGLVAAVSEGSPPRTARLIPAAELPIDLPEAVTSEVVPDPIEPPPLRSDDAGDDYLIALAAREQARIVSGDAHLLKMSDAIPVLSPRAALELIAS